MSKIPQDRYIRVGDINTRYWMEGNKGSNLMLVHGLGGSVENWATNVGPLSQHHRVYAMDLLGFGRTDKTPLIRSIYELVSFINEFMEVLQIEKASLVGNSLGGGLALQFALQQSEKVEKLILVDNAGIGKEVTTDFRLISIPLLGEFLTRPSRKGTAALWGKIVHDPSVITEDMVELGYDLMTLPGAKKALLNTLRAGINLRGQRRHLTEALLDKISTITVPTLIIWGKQDRMLPLAHAYKCHECLPSSELHMFDNCGHMPQLEYPDEFNELVLRFLDKRVEQTKQVVGTNTGQKKGKGKSLVKGIGFCSFGDDANTSVIDIKDGKIIRIRPLHFDWQYEEKVFKPWKIKAHGQVFEPTKKTLIPPLSLAYKKRVYSPNRILYPLKRVDWNTNGERNTENRGKSEYVRISWDEAIDIIVSEINRIRKKYGPYAILSQSDGHGETKIINTTHGSARRLLASLGGYTLQVRNPDSWEGWSWGAKHTWGMEPVGQMGPASNVIPDIVENTELLLFWGCDPETTPWGFDGQMASRLCYWFTNLGIKCIYICPDLNYGAAIHADKWVPIRPNTDAALQLAVAYIWITEGRYDKEYVATHTFGFDKFEPYVLGKEDGIPKTPEWAAEKTGVPARITKVLAREWALKRTSIAHGNGGAGIRSAYSTEPGRLEVLLLAMQGLGKPGIHQVKMLEWGLFFPMMQNQMPRGEVYPKLLRVAHDGKAMGTETPKQFIPKDLIHDAILKPPLTWYGNSTFPGMLEDQFVKYIYPVEGCSEVHMIWTDTPCWITCWNDSNSFIKAMRSPKIEFILAQHPWLENDCLFADIILPVSTKFEEQDIAMDVLSGQYYVLIRDKKCIDHVGESKSDYEITCMVAEKLGLLEEYTGGKTVEEWIKFCFENSDVQDMITYEEFDKKGYFVIPTEQEWEKHPPGLRAFYEDPESNPLITPSGKIEFYSQNLAKYFPDDLERPLVPHWIEKGESHDERLSSERAKKYPLILMSNHGRWRVHAQCDDITWTREAPTCKIKGPDGYKYEPLWINPKDAEARGIRNGDIIKIVNERGAVLGGAFITERIMPRVVYMDHGARYDPIVVGEIDRGGAINTITPHNLTSKNATGMVVSSFLVEVERVNLEEMRGKYPQAFKRRYHAHAGQSFDTWVCKKNLP